jgi:hypothetical protein
MPDYKRGKVYEIICRITGEKYIGSTTLKYLSSRLAGHINDIKWGKICGSKQILERGDYYINLIEECPCENKEQLLKKEREWYDKIEGGCVNKNRPYRTYEESKEDRLKSYHKCKDLEKLRGEYKDKSSKMTEEERNKMNEKRRENRNKANKNIPVI